MSTRFFPAAFLASLATLISISGAADEGGRVVVPPVTKGITRYGIPVSEDYTVEVNDRKVPVYTATIGRLVDIEGPDGAKEDIDPILTQASFVSFDFEGVADVVIHTTRPLENPVVHPFSSGVAPKIADNALTFSLTQPRNLMLELGREKAPASSKASTPRPSLSPSRPLFVFANPISAAPSSDTPGLKYFGPGILEIGHLEIKRGETIYLDAGAVLNGTLFAEGAHDIKILGHGILDGSATAHYSNLGIDLHNCKNVLIDGILIRDSPHWTVVPTRCEDVTIRNLKILNWRTNGDGIDPCNSHRVSVQNCFIYSSDDSISVKGCNAFHPDANEWSVEDITISDSTLMAGNSAFGVRIGNETRAPEMKNLIFKNLDFYVSGNEFGVLAGDRAALKNIVLQDSRIERYFGWVIAAEIDKGEFNHDKEYGSIQGLRISNLNILETWGEGASELKGHDADHKVSDVLFEHVKVLGKPFTNIDQSPGRIYPLQRPVSRNFVENLQVTP